MKIISTRLHGVADYLVSALLIASPWLFGFWRGGAESYVPIVIGATSLLYSLFTNYELGVVKTLNMRTHLSLDVLSGICLAVSPWLLHFQDIVFWPHLLVGILEVGVVLLSAREPYLHESNAIGA